MNVTDIWRVIEEYKLDSQTHDLVLEDIIEITCEGKSACDEPLAVVRADSLPAESLTSYPGAEELLSRWERMRGKW